MPRLQRSHLVLASTSPRRLELLRQLGLEPEVQAVSVDETPYAHESPAVLVRRLARAKALAARVPSLNELVLAADTVIDLDGQVLGKPADAAEARDMLLALANREHRVISGVAVRRRLPGRHDHQLAADNPGSIASSSGEIRPSAPVLSTHAIVVSTQVRFGKISPLAIARYAESDEPLGKAGAYAIQGFAAQFVASLSGSYSNVVGLPLHETARLLIAAGRPLCPPRAQSPE